MASPSSDLPVWYDDIDGFAKTSWDLIDEGLRDRGSPMHVPTLATLRSRKGCNLMPSLRSVVLRGVDRSRWCIWFHTDLRSEKIGEIRANPHVALHFYDPHKKFQIRLSGLAAIRPMSNQRAMSAWRNTRDHNRACYRVMPGPGEVIDKAGAYRILPGPEADAKDPGEAAFSVVEIAIDRMESLYLAGQEHRRACFQRAAVLSSGKNGESGLDGQWLVP